MPRLPTILALSTALVAAPAFAAGSHQDSTSTTSELVQYGDLDLTTAKGQKTLKRRLDDASRRVCMFDARGQIVTPRKEQACLAIVQEATETRFARLSSRDGIGG